MTVRRVRRIIRKFDPWTVLKVSFLFHAVSALAMVLGVVIMWSVLVSAGIPQAINDFAQDITLIDEGATVVGGGDEYFRVTIFLALVWTVVMTGFSTLAAVMYNLISDVVGGVEVVVLEETLDVPASGQGQVRQPRRWATAAKPSPSEEEAPELAEMPTEETAPVRLSR